MKPLILIILLFISSVSMAQEEQRYLEGNKVIYEAPLESDVLKVNASFGFCTVLEFKEKPILVTVGDNSLIQVEKPQNSKSVIIKPLEQSGETNLFVFTKSQRFNYKVLISNQASTDYVVDTKDSVPEKDNKVKRVEIGDVLRQAHNYSVLKDLRAVNDRKLIHKDLYYSYTYPKFKVDVIESFINKNPNYLILHVVIHNTLEHPLKLSEKNTKVMIGQQKFTPQYILFDSNKVKANGQTDGWLVLEGMYISIDNKFECEIGIKDDYVWEKVVS